MANKRSPQERQFSLVLALKVTRSGLTKSQILDSVNGYTGLDADSSAIDRMFERDKETLRESGVPVQTVPDLFEPENNQLTRYIISDADYAIPDTFELTTTEAQMVQLASALWTLGTSTSTTSNLLAKLTAKGIAFESAAIEISSFTDSISPLAATITDAISTHRSLTFEYTKQGATEPESRKVVPLALVSFQHRLVLWGWDLVRADYRSFLLERIGSMAKPRKSEIEVPDRSNAQARAIAHLSAASTPALLQVAEGTTAQVQLAKEATAIAGSDYTTEFVDFVLYARYLASFGNEVKVISPAGLRTQYLSTLDELIAQHSAPAPQLPDGAPSSTGQTGRRSKPANVDAFVLLLALVPYLLRTPYVHVSKAAQDFGTTTKAIEDAVGLIGVSGVPGESLSYLPQDLFEIDSSEWLEHQRIALTNQVAIDKAPALSNGEVTSILVSLQVLASVLPEKDAAVALSVAQKLSVGREGLPDVVPAELSTERKLLAKATDNGQRVSIEYVDATGKHSTRLFEATSTYCSGTYWYVQGFSYALDGEFQGERSLRIDRIAHLEITDAPVAVVRPVATGDVNQTGVDVIELDHGIRKDRVISGIAAYVRDVASAGGTRVVVSPSEIREQVLQWATSARSQYPDEQ